MILTELRLYVNIMEYCILWAKRTITHKLCTFIEIADSLVAFPSLSFGG